MFAEHTTTSAFGRALVVEDDQVLRRALVRGLRAWGVETLEASDVKSARRLLRLEPDLVVTDVRLPDGSGQEVARRAARLRTQPFIVAMSGEATPAEAFELARACVRVYLEKPFTLAELQARIGEIRARDGSGPLAWDDALPHGVRELLLSELTRFAAERGLTAQETEVLRHTLAGTPRAALPGALGVPSNTCKTLVRRVLRKCGLSRLAQVAPFVFARLQWQSPAG